MGVHNPPVSQTEPLAGLTLLNTRPSHQAADLTALAQAQGVTVLSCPTLAIESLALPQNAMGVFKTFDKIVFVSRNAVTVLAELFQLQEGVSPPFAHTAQCFAIGQATHQALLENHWPTASLNHDQFVSEDLLASEAMRDLSGQKILIVKGEGGRPTLKSGLTLAGADVTEWFIYRRIQEPFCDQAWVEFQAAKHPVLLASSLQAWSNLVKNLAAAIGQPALIHAQDWLFAQDIIVFSQRIEKAVKDAGWQGGIWVVPQQTNDGVLAALTQIRTEAQTIDDTAKP